MSKHWARQEAKKNELAEALEKTWTWGQSNRQQVTGYGGAALVVLCLAGYFAYQHWATEKAAWRQLAMAQSQAYKGEWDAAITTLKPLSMSERTSAWGFGILLEGDIYYRQNQFQQAATSYQKILDHQGPKDLIPFALSDLGQAQEAGKQYKEAAETNRRFLDLYKDHFLAPQTHASLARCLEAMGHGQEATAAYQQMVTLYPEDAYWSQWAQSRLKDNSKRS